MKKVIRKKKQANFSSIRSFLFKNLYNQLRHDIFRISKYIKSQNENPLKNNLFLDSDAKKKLHSALLNTISQNIFPVLQDRALSGTWLRIQKDILILGKYIMESRDVFKIHGKLRRYCTLSVPSGPLRSKNFKKR